MIISIKKEKALNVKKSTHNAKKWCLVHIGNDITYGLAFVAAELLKHKHKIMWLDGDDKIDELNKKIKDFSPDYVCFGPLSTEFKRSLELVDSFKKTLHSLKSVFGGKHVLAIPDEIKKMKT